METVYREGGAWRTLWWVLGGLVAGFLVDVGLFAGAAHLLGWFVAAVLVGGVVAVGCHAQSRLVAVRIDRLALHVGREAVSLHEIDPDALHAADPDRSDGGEVGTGLAGPPAGAHILGGSLTMPRGRVPLPLRLTDGRIVVAPSRHPDALRAALVRALPTRPGRGRTEPDQLGDLTP